MVYSIFMVLLFVWCKYPKNKNMFRAKVLHLQVSCMGNPDQQPSLESSKSVLIFQEVESYTQAHKFYSTLAPNILV